MERDYETNSSHYCTSRISLWCPVCGAKENQGCNAVGGLRYASHDAYATGQVPRPVIVPSFWETAPARKDVGNRPKWTPKQWTHERI